MKPTIVFDVDGILLKVASPDDVFGTIPDETYFEMAREAMSVGLRVVVLTGRTITDREGLRELERVFEDQSFHPDAIIPFPGRWRGFEAYKEWKLGWIAFLEPIAVIDDMRIFVLGM